MRTSTLREKIVESHGHRFVRLRSGRLFSFWDAISAIEKSHTLLVRSMSRAIKLAVDEWDYERVEYRLDSFEEYLSSVREYLEKERGKVSKRERIALLRNVEGRTPEEAEAFLRKADQLEKDLEAG